MTLYYFRVLFRNYQCLDIFVQNKLLDELKLLKRHQSILKILSFIMCIYQSLSQRHFKSICALFFSTIEATEASESQG
jgi:hypothetical protein